MNQIRTILVSGSIPTVNQLPLGDIAINTVDGKAYLKKYSGSVQEVIEIGSGITPISASYAATASYLTGTVASASYTISASYALSASYVSTASYALTASSALNAQDILIYVKNQSGNDIAKGVVVHITASGNSSDIPRIITASYENDNNSANTLGITNQIITNGSEGYVMTEGVLKGIDTNAFVSGQLIYLGATGSITGSAPRAPLHAVRLGQVVREQSNNGSIYVRIDNGYELGELHDVLDNSTTSSYGDLLVKSGSLWTNSKQLTGSYGLTGSLTATSFTGSFSGSGTITSASFSQTASYLNPLAQTVRLTGSLVITGSVLISSSATFTNVGPASFTGSAGTGSALAIYKSGSNVLSIDGSSGRLFSVDDSLSGSLFSVNTAAGLPVIEAFSDNTVNIGKYGSYPLSVSGSTLRATGSFTGSFTGNLSGSANLTTLTASGALINGNVTINGTASISFLNVTVESASVIYSTGSNQLGDAANDTQTLYGSVIIPTGSLTVTGSTIITGSLIVTDGITGSFSGSGTITSASFSQTASFLNPLAQSTVSITGSSINTSLLIRTISSSINLQGTVASQISVNRPTIGTPSVWRYNGSQGAEIGTLGSDPLSLIANNRSVAVFSDTGIITLRPFSQFLLTTGSFTYIFTTSSTGNVNVGALSDLGARLGVRGSGTTSTTTAFRVENSSTTARLTILDDGTSAFNTSQLYISSSGKISVGSTINAGYALEVYDTGIYYAGASSQAQFLITTSGSLGSREGAFLAAGSGRTVQLGITDNGAIPVGIDMFETNNSYPSTYINFRVNNADLVRMTGSFVGIGTTSPISTLDVSGSGRFTNGLNVTGSTTVAGIITQLDTLNALPAYYQIINLPSSIPGGGGAPTSLISIPSGQPVSMFIEYQIINTATMTDQRSGTIMANFNSLGTPTSTFTETVTADIGNTAGVVFTTNVGAFYDIQATNAGVSPYTFKAILRYF